MLLLQRFQRDERGATAILFGLMLLPAMAAVGAAVDYTRAATVRTALQGAVDAAALAAAKDSVSLPSSEIPHRARAVFNANFTRRDADLGQVQVVQGTRLVRVTAQAQVKTSILGIMNIHRMPVSASGEVGWGGNRIELALVLDNTGSMGSAGKMPALKKAVRDLLTDIESSAADSIKIGIVPFDTQVNIGTGLRDAEWLTFDGDVRRELQVSRRDWQGCVADRDQPYDINDSAGRGRAALYPAVRCGTGSLAAVQPLTSNLAALRETVDRMTPSGNTNLTIGVAWGLAMLNPDEPLGGARPFKTPRLDKVMVVLTDGDNTENRFTKDERDIDARSRLACQAVKDKGIRVFTIRVVEGNANLLRNCATETNMYYEVRSASEIGPAFKRILEEINSIRLTH